MLENFVEKSIAEKDLPLFKEVFNKKTVIEYLQDILKNPELLKKICDRSYTHALGFHKIVLLDMEKDLNGCTNKNQVRLHLWEPEADALPMVESLHEHSFDFISLVLSGHLENQRFKIRQLNKRELDLLEKIKKIKSNKDLKFINEQIEILEAWKLKYLGSKQFDDLKMEKNMNLNRLEKMLDITSEKALYLTTLEGHYVSNRTPGEKKSYKHILKEYVALEAQDVLKIDAGNYYFHPYTLAHRLYYDNKIMNSTILVTTQVKSNPEGGSLQRPTYVQEHEQNYDKKSFELKDFKLKLENYILFLKNNS